MRYKSLVLGSVLTWGGLAQAEVPHVATDIAPVYSLVSQVMQGVGTPDLIIPQSASPHSYAMRPSEARALSRADLVVWVGPVLSPWFEGPVGSLSEGAVKIELMDVPGTRLLAFREGDAFGAHDHDHGHDEDHDEDHDDHDEHAAEGHDDRDGDDHAEEEHHHDGGYDPHVWLDPQNASVWLPVIAEQLAAMDPDNAQIYRDNATTGQADLAALQGEIAARLAAVPDQGFAVQHDAYHYFEARFGVEASAAISLGDDAAPSAARLAEVRSQIAEANVRCLLVEPGYNAGLVDAVSSDAGARVAVISPLGAEYEPGPQSYRQMIAGLADALATCLQPSE